ncbi:oxysterol-binding protein [Sarocladium strictum]
MLTNWLYPAAEGNRSSMDDAKGGDTTDDDTQIMEPDEGNVLTHLISQLRPGADLSRVVLPTFILEPRSMLERITNFMCHPELLLHIPTIDDPTERFVSVVKFYLSGWHIRPPGVKKPLNPILGEIFTCYWDLDEGKHAYYISEQTSHHPPKSSYFYMAPNHHIRIDGTLKPRSKFLGNSAASLMEGIAYLNFLNRGDPAKGEQYTLTQPNMYARGILFGKMKYELGDHSFVRCPELDLTADLEFKTKGWVGGTYNAIGGVIKKESTGEVLYELSGLWSEEMFIKDMKTGHKEMFFNATRAKPSQPKVRPLSEQGERESQKLWEKVAKAVVERDHVLATDEKTKIEDRQREEAAARTDADMDWHPKLFRAVDDTPGSVEEGMDDLEWIIDAKLDYTASSENLAKQVLSIYPIIDGQQAEKEATPPRSAAPRSEEDLLSMGNDIQSKEAQPAKSQPSTAQDDLVDFGQNEATEKPVEAQTKTDASRKNKDEIADLLNSTGKPADGPLLNFTQDLKSGLPSGKPQPKEDLLS